MSDLSSLLLVAQQNWIILALFFLVAILYSSVGFGGGSSYLAILALSSMDFIQFRAIALLCNIVVVSGGVFLYYKRGLLNWKKVIPLALASIPMAFLGGYLRIERVYFFILLGFALIIAAAFMWMSKYIDKNTENLSKQSILMNGTIGAIIGFVSGMIGIGGGIFLAPVLHITRWDQAKKIAAMSSFFILVNSIAGLWGQYQSFNAKIGVKFDLTIVLLLMFTVFFGGQIGSRWSNDKLSPVTIKRITAVLIFVVGIKLLIKYV